MKGRGKITRGSDTQLEISKDVVGDHAAHALIDELIVPALVEKFIEAKLKLLALSEHNGDQS